MITEHLAEFNWTFTTTPEGWTHCFDEHQVQRCGRRKSNGEPCKSKILYDTGRCNSHQIGAANKRGFDHPATKDGRQSMIFKKLPSRLAEIFHSVRQNEDLLSLDDDIALLDTLMLDLMPRLHSGDLGKLWLDLNDAYSEAESNMRIALSGKNPQAMQDFLVQFKLIGEFIRSGRRDWITRQEIMKVADQKRATVKTVSDVEYKGENAITMSDFLALLEYMENTFMRSIQKLDRDTQNQLKQTYAEGLRKIIDIRDVS